MLRNFEEGHDFIRREFGITPTVAWQLDPFGHSSGLASLFAEIGFEATFFARMNLDEFRDRSLEQDLEFVWRPRFASDEAVEGARPEIFAHMLFDHYNPPDFVAYLAYHGNHVKPFNENHGTNWFNYFTSQAEAYRTKNVIVLWGDDFSH